MKRDLQQKTVRVVSINEVPFTTFDNGVLGGVIGELLLEISREMDFRIEYMEKENDYGSWDPKGRNWSGIMGKLTTGQADIGAAAIVMTTGRLRDVDFTHPLVLADNKLYFKMPDIGILWSRYFQVFSPGIWFAIGLLIIMTTVMLTAMKVLRGTQMSTDMVSKNFLQIFAIYCQQGLSEFPAEGPLKLAYFSIALSALLVYAEYSANLISYLTYFSISPPFATMTSFAYQSSYSLIVIENSAEYDMFALSKDPVLNKMWTKMRNRTDLPSSMEEGFRQVCRGNVAFYVTEALGNLMNFYIPCEVISISAEKSNALAMALPKYSPYVGVMNYHIEKYRESGVLDRLVKKYAAIVNSTVATHYPVGLWNVTPIFTILMIGVLMGILILIYEIVHFSSGKDGRLLYKGRDQCIPHKKR